MFGFPLEFLFFPNMTGPVAGNSYLNLRIRPNGVGPNACIFEIRSLFRFGEGKAPAPQREFIADWPSARDRIPVEILSPCTAAFSRASANGRSLGADSTARSTTTASMSTSPTVM